MESSRAQMAPEAGRAGGMRTGRGLRMRGLRGQPGGRNVVADLGVRVAALAPLAVAGAVEAGMADDAAVLAGDLVDALAARGLDPVVD